MNKKIRAIIIISLAVSIAFCAFSYKEDVNIVSSFNMMNDGNICYLNDDNVLSVVDLSGKKLVRRNLPEKKGGIIYTYQNICSDNEGNFYLLISEKKEDNSYLSSYIQQYDSHGRSEKRVFQCTEVRNRLYTIQSVNSQLIFFVCDYDNGSLKMYRYNPMTEKFGMKEYQFQVFPDFKWIKYTSLGSVYYADYDNRLVCLENATTGEYNIEINLENRGYPRSMPSYLSSDSNGMLYFMDTCTPRYIMYDETTDELTQIYEEGDSVIGDYLYEELFDIRKVNDCVIALANSFVLEEFFIFVEDETEVTQYRITDTHLTISRLAMLFLLSFAVCCAVLSLVYRAGKFFWNTQRIMVKQVFIMSSLLLVSALVLSAAMRYCFVDSMVKEAYFQVYSLASNMRETIDGDELRELYLPMDSKDPYYDVLEKELYVNVSKFYEAMPEAMKKELYFNVYQNEDFVSYLLFSSEERSTLRSNGEHQFYTEANAIIYPEGNSEDDTMQLYLAKAEDGDSLFCTETILDSSGTDVGKVEVGIVYDSYRKEIMRTLNRYILVVMCSMAAILIVLVLMTRRTLRGLGKLRQGVNDVMEGDWDTLVDINSRDELAEIGNAFNRMSRKVKTNLDSIEKLNTAYERFVPQQIFKLLNKESVMEVKQGDYNLRNMSVMSVSARDYYTVRETMSTEENFDFLNRLYGNITELVKESGGVVEDYRGAGLRCVYDGESDRAIDCALRILERYTLVENGQQLNLIVQRGDIMFGIVGSDQDYEAVAVSEILNYTHILQDIAESNGINLMVTLTAYQRISKPEKYRCRYIGRIRNKKLENDIIDVYDVIDAYPPEQRKNKMMTMGYFHRGVAFFIEGNLFEARKCFIDVIRVDKNDKMAQSYLFICDKYMENMPESWIGYYE